VIIYCTHTDNDSSSDTHSKVSSTKGETLVTYVSFTTCYLQEYAYIYASRLCTNSLIMMLSLLTLLFETGDGQQLV